MSAVTHPGREDPVAAGRGGVATGRREPAGTPAREALQSAVTAIAAAGCETPRLDGEVLLASVLGVDRARLLSDPGLTLRGASVRAFQEAVRRRAIEREPVAYITGVRSFRRIELGVDRRALVPRPETELLVETALTLPQGAHLLDVCTGSGAVALALKDERPDLEVWGSDLSEAALGLARENAARLGLRVGWRHADLLEGLPDCFDAVLANPPYVAERDLAGLAPEIVRHEPRGALAAGSDGLLVIRRLLAALGERRRVAFVAVEVGAGQAERVAALMEQARFVEVRYEEDLGGIKRVVTGGRG